MFTSGNYCYIYFEQFSSYQFSRDQTLCLTQIATQKEIFVVDWVALRTSNNKNFEKVLSTVSAMLSDESIIKVGWDFSSSDMPVMRKFSKKFFGQANNILDMQKLSAGFAARHQVTQNVRGLASCCEFFLGRALNKSEQMSNWAKRPLSPDQVTYASMDAHVLLALLEAIYILQEEKCTEDYLSYYETSVVDHIRNLSSTLKKQKIKGNENGKTSKIDLTQYIEGSYVLKDNS